MTLLKKPNSRSHLMIVIDHLSQEQLTDLGQQIKNLPTPPIVTLVKSVPILDVPYAEGNQEARRVLAQAKHSLNFPASGEVIHGSNPKLAKDFFIEGIFDAMINRGQHGQLSVFVKDSEATGIKELTHNMSVTHLSPELNKISSFSYQPVFATQSHGMPAAKQEPVAPQNEQAVKLQK